jgi:hypothetical protein
MFAALILCAAGMVFCIKATCSAEGSDNSVVVRYTTHATFTDDNRGDNKEVQIVLRRGTPAEPDVSWVAGMRTEVYTNQAGPNGELLPDTHGKLTNQRDTCTLSLFAGKERKSNLQNPLFFWDSRSYLEAGALNVTRMGIDSIDTFEKKYLEGIGNSRSSPLSSDAQPMLAFTEADFLGVHTMLPLFGQSVEGSLAAVLVGKAGSDEVSIREGLVAALGDWGVVSLPGTPASAPKGFGIFGGIMGKYSGYDLKTDAAGTRSFQYGAIFGAATKLPFINGTLGIYAELPLTPEVTGKEGTPVQLGPCWSIPLDDRRATVGCYLNLIF